MSSQSQVSSAPKKRPGWDGGGRGPRKPMAMKTRQGYGENRGKERTRESDHKCQEQEGEGDAGGKAWARGEACKV